MGGVGGGGDDDDDDDDKIFDGCKEYLLFCSPYLVGPIILYCPFNASFCERDGAWRGSVTSSEHTSFTTYRT